MKWTESYKLIEIYKGDYGEKINFNTEDFIINDEIIFVFENNIIPSKIYTVETLPFEFQLTFNKEEIENLEIKDYKFSVKQYRNNELLDTLFNGILRIKETEVWEQ